MSTASTQYRFLETNWKSAYKQLFIKGTRIRARVLYGWCACEEPMSPGNIAADYGLPIEAVEEAIAYCESYPPELEEVYRYEEALIQAAGMNQPNYKRHPSPKLLSPQERDLLKRS